jgi:hypothetical protein
MATPGLFDQALTQVNLLLDAQRNIILISAFGLTLATFRKNFKYPLIKEMVGVLFAYAIAVGIKSILDFNAFIIKVKHEELNEDERDLIKRWGDWVIFSYILSGIIITFFCLYLYMEFTSKKNWFGKRFFK